MRSKQNQRRKYPWQRRRRTMLFVVAVPLTVVLGFFVWRANVRGQGDAAVAAMAAMGIPTTAEDYTAWRKAAPGEDGSELLTRACAAIAPLAPDRAMLIPDFAKGLPDVEERPYNEAALEAADAVLAENEEALRLFREAAEAPVCRFINPQIHNQWNPSMVPSQFPALQRLVGLEAKVAATRGDLDTALTDVLALLKLGKALGADPGIHRRRIDLNRQAVSLLGRVLAFGTPDIAQLDRVAAGLEASECPDAVLEDLVNTIAQQVLFLRGGLWGRNPPPVDTVIRLAGGYDRALVQLSGMVADTLEAASLEDYQQIEQRGIAVGQRFEAEVSRFSPLQFVWVPRADRTALTHFADRARLRAARGAIAVARFRAEHGRLPESATELPPGSLPEDPFGDGPLRYLKEESGYAVYSVSARPEGVESRLNEGPGRGFGTWGEVPLVRVTASE